MPTKADFEIAAGKFEAAGAQIGALTITVENADASRILRGGALGRQVPDRIAEASVTARTCRELIEDAAQTCRDRAAVIADYETRLDSYQMAYLQHTNALFHWSAQQSAWSSDTTGLVADPGPAPQPPGKPTPPPAWADVIRP